MKIFKLLLRLTLWGAFLGSLMAGAALVGAYIYVQDSLPRIDSLADYRPPIITRVFADDGSLIAEFSEERRIVVPYDQIPEQLVQAFVAAEDANFFGHEGIDLLSIVRAAIKNFQAGRIVQGGSTITQQVAKGFLLTPEKKFSRKFKEAILAYRIEQKFSKEEILYLYLNQIYLGHGAYGVQAAAENYFDKDVDELNLAECAILAGLPQAPSRYSPYRHFDRARDRQRYVLKRMSSEGYIDRDQMIDAQKTPVIVHKRVNYRYTDNAYFTEQVRRYLEENFTSDVLYREGLQVHTSLNLKMQQAGQQAVQDNLRNHDKRQGYQGTQVLTPEEAETFLADQSEKLEQPPANGDVVQGIVRPAPGKGIMVVIGPYRGRIDPKAEVNKWAAPLRLGEEGEESRGNRKVENLDETVSTESVLPPNSLVLVRVLGRDKQGTLDLALEQEATAQGALVAMDPHSGEIKAMVGGYDFKQSQYNRAIQAKRLPGSAIKPLIYAAALDKGYTPASIILDTPLIYEELREETGKIIAWKPRNYSEKFYGPTRFRKALASSMNVVTIKILEDIGVRYAANYAQKLGVDTPLTRDLTLGLGSTAVTPLEITRAYCTFANGGVRVTPSYISRIYDRDGNILHSIDPADFPEGIGPGQKLITEAPQRVITQETAYLITNIMESVVQEGTGRRAKRIGRPLAGKTGTTNDLKDAWFVGFSPSLVATSWVGYDIAEYLGKHETGSRAASPAWINFMDEALQERPVAEFPVPDTIEFHPIDRETGLLLDEAADSYIEVFAPGTAPTRFADEEVQPTARDFFRLDLEENL